MIPPNGSIEIIGTSGALTTTTVGAVALTGTTTSGSTQIIVTTAPNIAFANLNSTNGLFLTSAAVSPFAACTRVIAQRSPIGYTATNISWSSNTLSLTISNIPAVLSGGQTIHLQNTLNPSLSTSYVLTGTSGNVSALTLQFSYPSDPGTGFNNAVVFPGINTSNLTGYYTINRPATASVSANTIVANTQARNPFVVPSAATHVIATSGTAAFGNINIDATGSVGIPCGQVLALKNLKGGNCFMATGTTDGTDIRSLAYVTYNPLGNP
jgi:hypothetical protein